MLDFLSAVMQPILMLTLGRASQADAGLAGRLIEKGEAKLREYQHPDPYIVPYYPGGVSQAGTLAGISGIQFPLCMVHTHCIPRGLLATCPAGGSLYARNPPFPKDLKQHFDWGRENGH